jgi:hypothetical protein
MNWEKREMKRLWLLCIPLRESGALRTHAHANTCPDDSVAKRGPTSETRRRVEVITRMCQKSLQRFVVPNDIVRVVRLGGRR